ncbi:MAG: DUF1353 domain-containing protein [Ilumatobacteraceae bacterium]
MTTSWTRWRVAPGFEVASPDGLVRMQQVDRKNFQVLDAFRFTDATVLADIRKRVPSTVPDPDRAVEDARTLRPVPPVVPAAPPPNPGTTSPTGATQATGGPESVTDLASIPWFMRWFVNTYGKHTLAAILHDQLIGDRANSGALGSDTLADRFFREMMGTAGVRWLKRWIMWAAVAIRSRWAVGGIKRAGLILWFLLAIGGIGLGAASFGAAAGWGHLFGWSGWALLAVAAVLPVVSAPLWGKQFGASLIAAPVAMFLLPAAVLAAVGMAIYLVLEGIFYLLGRR